MNAPKKLTFADPSAVLTWGYADDVSLYATDAEGNLMVIGMTASQARSLADQLLRAAHQAQDLDEGYFEACVKDFELGRDYTEDAILSDPEVFNEFNGMRFSDTE